MKHHGLKRGTSSAVFLEDTPPNYDEEKLTKINDENWALMNSLLLGTDGWKQMKSKVKSGREITVSKKEITDDIVYWRATTTIKRSPAYLVDVFYSKFDEMIKNRVVPLNEFVVLKEFYDFRIAYGRIRGVAMFSSRDNCFMQSIHINGNERTLYQRSLPGILPDRKGHIRITKFFTAAHLAPHPTDPNKSIVTAVAHNDFGGLIPKKLYNSAEAYIHIMAMWKNLEKITLHEKEVDLFQKRLELIKSEHRSSASDLLSSDYHSDPHSSDDSADSYTGIHYSELSPKEDRLHTFLKSLDLESYFPTFQKEDVTYKMLLEMEEKDLQDMGIPFGPRRTIHKAISKIKPNEQGIPQVENIQIVQKIGKGSFGEVYEGVWEGTTRVALKVLHEKSQMDAFLKEAHLLQHLVHPNILRFFGIGNVDGDQYIVIELMQLGDLRNFLINEKNQLTTNDLLLMSQDVVAGLTYLRDLSARNLLVTKQEGRFTVKLSDFGLSRSLENDYYSLSNDSRYPVRWTAPEVFESKKYSIESDVWSLGIVIWEMFSFGAEPYEYLSNKDVIKFVQSGKRLECPECCPPVVFEEVISPCWKWAPTERPNYKNLFRLLENIHKMMDNNPGKDDIFDEYEPADVYASNNVDDHVYKVTP